MFKRVLQSGIHCLAILLSLIDPLVGQTQSHRRKLTTDIKEIVLENRLVSRKFATDNGWLRTSHLVNLLTGESIVVSSPEFEIQLENEPVLSSQDFAAEYYTHVLLAGEVKRTLFTLTEKRQRLRLELEYTLGPNDFFVRKRVRLYALQKSLPRLISVTVEALRVGNVHSSFPSPSPGHRAQKPSPAGGAIPRDPSGQPVFLNDNFFWGMEHPAGRNRVQDGIVRCSEYPGNRISSSGFESHSAVAGISPRGEVAEWFLRYVDTFRLAPRPLTILTVPSNHSGNVSLTEVLERKMEAIPKGSRQSGKRLVDVLVLDAGWWPKNLSLPLDVSLLPQRLGTVSQVLRSRGAGLGLYFPLSSAEFTRPSSSVKSVDTAIDASSSKSEPVRVCLADPRYQEALKSRLKELHQGNPLRLVRHDLSGPLCQSALHGHGVEADVSYQAMTEALIGVLRFERSLDSDLYVSLVGRDPPSPWWLQYANDVGPGDLGRDQFRMDLSPRPRDWQIQREGLFLQGYLRGEPFQFPFSRLTASRLQAAIEDGIGPKEPEESWADAVAEYLGRGQDVTELSFDPEQLDAAAWEILSRGLEWKTSRHSVFRQASTIGGTIEKGEPYGYLHWNTNQAIAVLHNPSPSPHETSFHLPKSLKGPLRILQTYPRCRVESQVLKAGDIVNTSLEGLETRVFEVNPEGAWSIPLPQDTDFVLSSSTAGGADERPITVKTFPETSEVRFSLPQFVVGLQLGERPIALGASGRAELPDDPQTNSKIAALTSFTEKKAEVGVYAKRGAQLTLPEWSAVRSSLAIWLLQPEEQRRNFPLYVTLDRKQIDLANRESFTPPAETRTWNFYSLPLKFEHQVLLDWAIKDVKDVSLCLWWEIAAPRPELEFTYRLASGRAKDAFPPLLSSPRGSDYVVRIPLEVDKPQQSTDTP
jgi:hypothetical protein